MGWGIASAIVGSGFYARNIVDAYADAKGPHQAPSSYREFFDNLDANHCANRVAFDVEARSGALRLYEISWPDDWRAIEQSRGRRYALLGQRSH